MAIENEEIQKNRNKLLRALYFATNNVKCTNLIYMRILDNTDFSHTVSFSSSEPDKISFSPDGNIERRMRSTLGRYVRRRLKLSLNAISDKTLAKFCAAVFAGVSDPSKYIKLVRGEEITLAYMNNHGGSSCMTGDYARDGYVKLYELNPDIIELLVYSYSGFTARALVWKVTDTIKVIDRIYPNSGSHIDAIHMWAKKNNYVYRTSQGYPESPYVGLSNNIAYSVDLKHDGMFPYLDTFHWGEVAGDRVTLSTEESDWPNRFEATNGDYMDSSSSSCYSCGSRVYEDDVYAGGDEEIYCCNCFGSNWAYCAECDGLTDVGNTVYTNDMNYCESCHSNLFAPCENCEETTSRDVLTEVNNEKTGDSEEWCEACRDDEAKYCDDCDQHSSIKGGLCCDNARQATDA